jgi:hypothetical protein
VIISSPILHRIKKFSAKSCTEIKTRISLSIPCHNLGVTFDGSSLSIAEHTKHLAVVGHHICAGFVLPYAAMPAPPSYISNWQIFPNFS